MFWSGIGGFHDRAICVLPAAAVLISNGTAHRVLPACSVWVPPFPNDSGAAIGAACSAMAADRGFVPLEWSVYSGPALIRSDVPSEWEAAPCSMRELATLLASNKPVVFLAGHAELGHEHWVAEAFSRTRHPRKGRIVSTILNVVNTSGQLRDMPGGSRTRNFQSRNAGSLRAARLQTIPSRLLKKKLAWRLSP